MIAIAIVGAECTGKSTLARTLSHRLTNAPDRAVWVPEVLRGWCDRQGRTPLAHEQVMIAREQMQHIEAAPPCDFLLVDSPPLMTALYSDLYFADRSLYSTALIHIRQFKLVFLMGMDLHWRADGIQRDGLLMRQRVNNRLRQVLDEQSIEYTVMYGTGSARTDVAMQVIENHLNKPRLAPATPSGPWAWHCDKCSDAQCEHRIFTSRLQL